MSVKKTGTGYTITEEQKNKADKQILARMEAGKGEIMKLVEGVPGSEKLTELIERGKKKGSLSSSELLDVLESLDLGSEQMDKIYDTLEIWASTPRGRTISPRSPRGPSPRWRLSRRSPRRKWWIPTPWRTPSALTTPCVCI